MKRKILVITAYIPPKSRASQYKGAMAYIAYIIDKAKNEMNEPFIIIGGDFNRFKMTFVNEFIDVEEILTDTLVKCCTNMDVVDTRIKPPPLYRLRQEV